MNPKEMSNAGIASRLEEMTKTGLYKEVPPAAQAVFEEAVNRLRGTDKGIKITYVFDPVDILERMAELTAEDCGLEVDREAFREARKAMNKEVPMPEDLPAIGYRYFVGLHLLKALGREPVEPPPNTPGTTVTVTNDNAREDIANALGQMAFQLLEGAEHVRGGASVHERNGELTLKADLVVRSTIL